MLSKGLKTDNDDSHVNLRYSFEEESQKIISSKWIEEIKIVEELPVTAEPHTPNDP